jgi:hypothetical protein
MSDSVATAGRVAAIYDIHGNLPIPSQSTRYSSGDRP